MSHFSVIVVTKEEPSADVLAAALQPFHEFECTGIDDQYIQDIDITDEAVQGYLEGDASMMKTPSGDLISAWDDQFYREPTQEEREKIGPIGGTGWGDGMHWTSKDWGDGNGYSTRVHYVPEGYEQIDVPKDQVQTFAEFIRGEHGIDTIYDSIDEVDKEESKYRYAYRTRMGIKVFRRTNPNAQWDYWRVGGRYASKFQVFNQHAAVSSDPSWEWKEGERPEGYDVAQFCNIDFDGMKREAVLRRSKWVSECMENCKMDWSTFELALKQNELAHKAWSELPEPRPRGEDYTKWLTSNGYDLAEQVRQGGNWFNLPEIGDLSLQEFIDAAPAITSFALLDAEGVWHQNGDMGWFGCVSNEDESWDERFQKLFRSIDPDHWVTVVDCHI